MTTSAEILRQLGFYPEFEKRRAKWAIGSAQMNKIYYFISNIGE